MLVTSDVYDIPHIARMGRYDWNEWLIAGIDFYGATWPGFQRTCQFSVEAAEFLNQKKDMVYGGYDLVGASGTRQLRPASIYKAAQDSGNRYEDKAIGTLLRGVLKAPEGEGSSYIGGAMGMSGQPEARRFSGRWIYVLDRQKRIKLATTLLSKAVCLLDVEYGYFFIRDNLMMPETYGAGMTAGCLVLSRTTGDQDEIHNWGKYKRGDYWREASPRLRDVYEVNLISDRHLARNVNGLKLGDWIIKDKARGNLAPFENGTYLWTLTTEQMQSIRPDLMSADAILARHERVYRPD